MVAATLISLRERAQPTDVQIHTTGSVMPGRFQAVSPQPGLAPLPPSEQVRGPKDPFTFAA